MAKRKTHAGMFKKGGGRVGGGGTTTVVVAAPPAAPKRKRGKRKVAKHHPVKKGKRRAAHRGAFGGSVSPVGLGATALVLASAAGTNTGPLGTKVYDLVQKVPGAKTFGGAATLGLIAGGLHHFTKVGGGLRPYMRLAGIVGIVAAGIKIGEAGTSFKWLGGEDAPFEID